MEKAVKEIRDPFKEVAAKIKPKMQMVCKAGNKIRPKLGYVLRGIDMMNCGFKRYGQCNCPKEIVDVVRTPIEGLKEYNEFVESATGWLLGESDDPLKSVYNLVCNPEDLVIAAWEEIKGILWDVIYEDIIGPIETLFNHEVCVDLWVSEFCTSLMKILTSVANAVGAVLDLLMAPLEPLLDLIIDMFLTPIENAIDALMEKLSPGFNWPAWLDLSMPFSFLNFPTLVSCSAPPPARFKAICDLKLSLDSCYLTALRGGDKDTALRTKIWQPLQNMVNSMASLEDLTKAFEEQNRLVVQPALIKKNEWCSGRKTWDIPASCSEEGLVDSIDVHLRAGPPRDCIDMTSERCKHNNCVFVGDWDAEVKYKKNYECTFYAPFSGRLTFSQSKHWQIGSNDYLQIERNLPGGYSSLTYNNNDKPSFGSSITIPKDSQFTWKSNDDASQGYGFEMCMTGPTDAFKKAEIDEADLAVQTALAASPLEYEVSAGLGKTQGHADLKCGTDPVASQREECSHRNWLGICTVKRYYSTCTGDAAHKKAVENARLAYHEILDKQGTLQEIADFDVEEHKQRKGVEEYTTTRKLNDGGTACESGDTEIKRDRKSVV